MRYSPKNTWYFLCQVCHRDPSGALWHHKILNLNRFRLNRIYSRAENTGDTGYCGSKHDRSVVRVPQLSVTCFRCGCLYRDLSTIDVMFCASRFVYARWRRRTVWDRCRWPSRPAVTSQAWRVKHSCACSSQTKSHSWNR